MVFQKRVKFTDQETAAIKKGVRLFGESSWADIKRRFSDVLHKRDPVQIKDKWRNMTKNQPSLRRKVLSEQRDSTDEEESSEDEESSGEEEGGSGEEKVTKKAAGGKEKRTTIVQKKRVHFEEDNVSTQCHDPAERAALTSYSFQLSSEELRGVQYELKKVEQTDHCSKGITESCPRLMKFVQELLNLFLAHKEQEYFPGPYVMELFGKAGIDFESYKSLRKDVLNILDHFNKRASKGLGLLKDFYEYLEGVFKHEDLSACQRLCAKFKCKVSVENSKVVMNYYVAKPPSASSSQSIMKKFVAPSTPTETPSLKMAAENALSCMTKKKQGSRKAENKRAKLKLKAATKSKLTTTTTTTEVTPLLSKKRKQISYDVVKTDQKECSPQEGAKKKAKPHRVSLGSPPSTEKSSSLPPSSSSSSSSTPYQVIAILTKQLGEGIISESEYSVAVKAIMS